MLENLLSGSHTVTANKGFNVSSYQKSPQSQEALVSAAANGDKDSFRKLVEFYQGSVFNLIMRQVGDFHTAEELSQEVFIKAYQGIKKFRQDSSFKTWLIRIALNHTNSYFTSKKYKKQKITTNFEVSLHDTGQADAEEMQNRKELVGCFQKALAQLKPRQREVIVLCALEGKSYEEVAGILKIPVGTVRSRLNAARLSLKKLMKDFR